MLWEKSSSYYFAKFVHFFGMKWALEYFFFGGSCVRVRLKQKNQVLRRKLANSGK